MAYTTHQWVTGEAITQEKMNNIHSGIDELKNTVAGQYTAAEVDQKIANVSSDASTALENATAVAQRVGRIEDKLETNSDIDNTVRSVMRATTQHDPAFSNLDTRFTAAEDRISTAESSVSAVKREIEQAHVPGYEDETLSARFRRIEDKNSTQDTNITTLSRDIIDAAETQDEQYLKNALIKMDAHTDAVEAEVEEARGLKNGIARNKLLDHFVDDEALIATAQETANNANGEISKIKATLGMEVSSTPEQTVVAKITAAQTAAQTYTDSQISVNNTNTRIAQIVAANRTAEDTLDDRFDDIETRLDAVDGQSGTVAGLNSRLATAEGDIDALESRMDTAEGDIDNLEGRVDTAEDDIDALELEISNAHRTGVQDDTLTARFEAIDDAIEDLNNKSNTIIVTNATFDINEMPELPEGMEPSENNDYLIKKEDKYYYWKYINNQWELISGSGSGNASALVFETQTEFNNATALQKDENTDYYVKDINGNYTHYRFSKAIVDGEAVYTPLIIKQDAYTTSQTYAKNEVYNRQEADTAIATAIAGIESDEYTFVYGTQMYYGPGGQNDPEEGLTPVETENVLSLFYHKGGTVDDPISVSQTIIVGGGGGASTGYPVTFNRITSTPIILTESDNAIIQFEYRCVDTDNLPVNGTYSVRVGTTTIMSNRALVQGTNTVDVTQYCTTGTQRFRIYLSVEEGADVPAKYWDVQVVDVRIESNFNDRYIYDAASAINFTYTPYGANTEKTVHIKLDGTEVFTTTTMDSGIPKGYTIQPQTHGAHLVEAYITATVNSKNIETPHIYKDIVCAAAGNNTPIIGCIYRYDYYGALNIKQYNSFSIPYYVYDPRSATPTIILAENGEEQGNLKVSTNANTWAYKSSVVTTTYAEKESPIVPADLPNLYEKVNNQYVHTTDTEINNEKTYYVRIENPNTLTITCGATSVIIKANIESLGYNIVPITDNLVFDFNPTGHSNKDEATRLWTYNNGIKTTSLTVSSNFDWNNGGYQLDSEGNMYFCIKSGTRAYIDHKLFETNPKMSGAEFKCIFKTTNVGNAQASFLRCMTGEIIPINNPPSGFLKVLYEKNANDEYVYTVDEEIDPNKQYYINNDRVALEMKTHAATITTSDQPTNIPYSEDDIIEFEYNIHAIDTEDDAAESYIMTYEDGVGARPILYSNSSTLHQYDPAIIEIGSDDCDVYIYRMKVYNTELTDSAVLQNFYADARNAEEMINRYERNLIYDENNKLTPESVSLACPELKVITIEAPYFTNDKANYVKNTTVRCMQGNAGPESNWTWENGFHVGQGTSSNRYGAAGRNIDIIFGFDGVNTPVSKIKANTVQGYVSKVTFSDGTSLTGADAKVALSPTSVPNSWFNIKVNIASSENANNALLQKRFNDYLPYKNRQPAMRRDSRIKNSMEFYNCVIFIKETDTVQDDNGIYTAHREFPRDTDWHFYGIGNIGDSKKTDNTRVNNPWDIKEFTVEVSDNNLPNTMFQTGVYDDGNGGYTFTPPDDDIQRMERMLYPITEDQWQNENNLARKALSLNGYVSGQSWNEDKQQYEDVITNWDSSFEFRYDTGTKDGESFDSAFLKAQQKKSKNKFNEFYHWVITAPTSGSDSFASHLKDWFVEEAALYWYLFTERYIMIDSRAKNTFYHWGKVFINQNEFDGTALAELQAQLAEATDENHDELQAAVDAAEYVYNHKETYVLDNASAAINEGYRFEMWDYDNDTALGIDNSGIMNIAYGKEDRDKRPETGGYYFNAALNIFWQRIRQEMNSQLTTLYQSTELTTCWSANNLITEFDKWQSQFPEELWRLDIERKYMRPFLQGSWNQTQQKYSTDKTFLRDMANGRKRYQRRQFERDQEIYVATKYLQSAVYSDSIELRLGNGDSQSVQVVPIVDAITITPYSDMYIRVMFGNASTVVSQRAFAGNAYTVYSPNPIAARESLQVVIYGASRIQALDDLASFYIRDNNFARAVKLKKLIIGSTVPGYKNTAINSLGIGANHLLETLDIRNCPNLTGPLNLTQCENLVNLYATNTAVTSVAFATGGRIANAYLPGTLSNISCSNLRMLNNLNTESYDLLTRFTCYDSNIINPLSIVTAAISSLQEVTVTELTWDLSTTALLDSILSKSSSLLTGIINYTGTIKRGKLNDYAEAWPELTINVDELNGGNIIEQYKVSFYDEDGETRLSQYDYYLDANSELMYDPVYNGATPPTKEPSTESVYSFGAYIDDVPGTYRQFSGWINIQTGEEMRANTINKSMSFKAVYYAHAREYNINWYGRNNVLLATAQATYGSEASTDVIPANGFNESTGEAYTFKGWDKSTGRILGDTDVYALWDEGILPTRADMAELSMSDLSPAQLYALGQIDINDRKTILNGNDHIGDEIVVPLGIDYEFSNVPSTVLVDSDYIMHAGYGTTRIFNGQNGLPLIQLCNNNDPFTLVLDYKFTSTTNDMVLAGNYEYGTEEQGFKLYTFLRNSVPEVRVSWGSSASNYVTVGGFANSEPYRDIVVIRRQAGSNNISVYYTVANQYLGNDVVKNVLTRATSTGTNIPFIIGARGAYDSSSGATSIAGSAADGVLYWAKLWHDDLGDVNCRNLAAWYHENMPMRLEGYNDSTAAAEGSSTYKIIPNPYNATNNSVGLTFVGSTAIGDRPMTEGTTTDTLEGWKNSARRAYMNSRVYKAIPTLYKSIIAKTPLTSHGKIPEDETAAWPKYQATDRKYSDDYIYSPSRIEVDTSITLNKTPESYEALHHIPWYISNSVANYYEYTGTNAQSSTSLPAAYSKIKFYGRTIKSTAKWYRYSANPYSNAVNQGAPAVQPGDIWIPTGNTYNAYMYVSQTEVNNYKLPIATGAAYTCTDTNGNAAGGWLPACNWWTRSIQYNDTGIQYSNYYYVTKQGRITQSALIGGGESNSGANSLVVQFSV